MQDGFSGWGVSECGVESRLEAESLTLPASEEMNGWGYRSLQMDALVMTLTPPPEKLNRIWIGGKGAAGEQPSRARMHSLVRTQAKPRFSSSVSLLLDHFRHWGNQTKHTLRQKRAAGRERERLVFGGCWGIIAILAM